MRIVPKIAAAASILVLASSVSAGPQEPQISVAPKRPARTVQPPPADSPQAARIAQVRAKIGADVAVVPAQTTGFRGIQDDKDFTYLTGLPAEPGAFLVVPGGDKGAPILFTRRGDPEGMPAWMEVRPLTDARMALFAAGPDRKVYLPFAGLEGTLEALGGSMAVARTGGLLPLDPVMGPLRIVKSPAEIALLKKAIAVTTEAYNEALAAIRPGMTEADVNALIQFVDMRRGGSSSFTQVASGPNSVNIHFESTPRAIEAEDAIVFDLGEWLDGYTSDLSRTIPVGGRFTKEQGQIYEIVLRAQKEAVRMMTPGRPAIEPCRAAEKIMMEGLRDLGLVTDPGSRLQKSVYIQHGFCHGIGLDIHDVFPWWGPRMETEPLRAGMVLTMEPGLYFPADRLERMARAFAGGPQAEEWKAFVAAVAPVYAKYAGLGCRIEDDVLVTESGNEVLTSAAPKEVKDIEAAMKRPGGFGKIFR